MPTASAFSAARVRWNLPKASSVLTLSICLFSSRLQVCAADYFWTNAAGGAYSSTANWTPNSIPGNTDKVAFTNASSYPLNVDVAANNPSVLFHRGSITQAISAASWVVSEEWKIGESAGTTSRVTSVNGLLSVTNAIGSAILNVGNAGTGELAIRGGRIITDTLTAINGNRSILTLANGELTTLRGTTVSNDAALVVGIGGSNVLTWNVLGGTHRIIADPNTYGSLTLGGRGAPFGPGGRARMILNGSNTVFSVPGLDSYGSNELYILNGAKLQTAKVQWGLSDGSNNVLVIDGPGSSWVNSRLMNFGMHAGGQTMILTNGGYFQHGPGIGETLVIDTSANRIIVTGSNSWFYSAGPMTIGHAFANPIRNQNTFVTVTEGGRFWASSLSYGALGSLPGNVLNVASGGLWIGTLGFMVGTLRIEQGSGIIEQVNIAGGTNAILEVRGTLYMGHDGDLNPGELRIGGAAATIPSLSGELRLGGWQLGGLVGKQGSVVVSGGRAFVTNMSHTAVLVVGGAGSGLFRVDNGRVQADQIQVAALAGSVGGVVINGISSELSTPELMMGQAGTMVVSNSATLQLMECTAPQSSILVNGGTVEFITAEPTLSDNAITTSNAIVSFHGVTGAAVDPMAPSALSKIRRSGKTFLQLRNSTNAPLPFIGFGNQDPSTWSGLILNGGASEMNAGAVSVAPDSAVAATNTITVFAGAVTNHGRFILENSTLRFVGPVFLSGTTVFSGSQGVLEFQGGVHLPSTDVVVPAGVSVRATTIASEGGQLLIEGGGLVAGEDGSVPGGFVSFQNGWITYVDVPAAPLTPPNIPGILGVEFVRSTNAPVMSMTFAQGTGDYQRLRLNGDSAWRSQNLSVGSGGEMIIANPSASVVVTSGVFRVENGGEFHSHVETNHVGFHGASVGAMWSVNGNGSTLESSGVLAIGSGGSSNQVIINSGGQLLANAASLGGSGVSKNFNRLTIEGPDSIGVVTNILTFGSSQNQLLVRTRGSFTASRVIDGGAATLISVAGPGTVAALGQIDLTGGFARLEVLDGGKLLSSNTVISDLSGARVDLSGPGTLWSLSGGLTITSPFGFATTNRILISTQAVLSASSVAIGTPFLTAFPNRGISVGIQSGQLYVTNSIGNATLSANGLLFINGGRLRADRLTASDQTYSAISLRAGKAEWRACDLIQTVPLRVGDGTNLATLNLLGGTNTCRGGLEVRRYGELTGSGVIVGAVTSRGWCSPSAIAIRGSLTLDATSGMDFVLTGPPGSPLNSSLVITGAVSLAGTLQIRVLPGAIPTPGQNFVLMQGGTIGSQFSNVAFGQRLLTSDRLASFRIDKPGNTIVATDFRSEDLDGDMIQDAWATQHFGFTPLQPGIGTNDLDGDRDGDGMSNREEFLLGTDPNDPSSAVEIRIVRVVPAGVEIHFPYRPNQSYTMWTSSDLVTWVGQMVEAVSFNAAGLAVWRDSDSFTSNRFYQLAIEGGAASQILGTTP